MGGRGVRRKGRGHGTAPPGVADEEHQDGFGKSVSTGKHEGRYNS